jgi:hypothetical protein
VNILSVAHGLFLSTLFHQISYQLLMAYFSSQYSIKYIISCSCLWATDKIFTWSTTLDGIQWREISHEQLIRYLMEYSGESYQFLMAYFSPLYSIKYLISCLWLISLHSIPSNILSVAHGLFLSTVFHQISYQLLIALFLILPIARYQGGMDGPWFTLKWFPVPPSLTGKIRKRRRGQERGDGESL